MKEEIIKELVEKVTEYGFNDEYGYYNDWADGVRPIIETSVLKILEELEKRKNNIHENMKEYTDAEYRANFNSELSLLIKDHTPKVTLKVK